MIACCLLLSWGCNQAKVESTAASSSRTVTDELTNVATLDHNKSQLEKPATDFKTIDWLELIPKSDLEVLLNPPDYIMEVEDGSIEDQIISNPKSAENVYEQALISTNVISAMNGKNIRIPGFVVPVEFNDKQQVISFFLVPYFGACLHMPPPPPNQVIYVESEQGITLQELYEPVMITGELSTELFEDQIATSAYTMQLAELKLYDEEVASQ